MKKIIPVVLTALLAFLPIGPVYADSWETLFVSDDEVDMSVLTDSTNVDPAAADAPDVTADSLDGVLKNLKEMPAQPALYTQAAALYSKNQNKGFKVFAKGTLIDFSKYDNVEPEIVDGRTLVPLRALAENLGATVAFDAATREITITLNEKVIKLTLDSPQAWTNGVETTLEVPAAAVGGRTMVPLRFVGEAFGKTVGWYPSGEVKVIGITD